MRLPSSSAMPKPTEGGVPTFMRSGRSTAHLSTSAGSAGSSVHPGLSPRLGLTTSLYLSLDSEFQFQWRKHSVPWTERSWCHLLSSLNLEAPRNFPGSLPFPQLPASPLRKACLLASHPTSLTSQCLDLSPHKCFPDPIWFPSASAPPHGKTGAACPATRHPWGGGQALQLSPGESRVLTRSR